MDDNSPLETVELASLSEDDHQELDRAVLADRSSFDLLEPSSLYTRLLVAIIDTSLKSVNLDSTYQSYSEAEKLVSGNPRLLEELKDAWKIQKFTRIRSLKILQRNGRRRWIMLSLIRHAQSITNAEEGHPQPGEPLTALGELQAETLGKCWANVHIDHFYASPYKRAQMTAQAIARHNPQAPEIQTRDELIEQNFGDEVRKTPYWDWERIFTLKTGQSPYMFHGPNRSHRPPGGGESYEDVNARAKGFLLSLLAAHGVEIDMSQTEHTVPKHKPDPERFIDERIPHVVVVSHGIFLIELYETLIFFNSPSERYDMKFKFENTSMCRIAAGLDESNREEPLELIGVVNIPRVSSM